MSSPSSSSSSPSSSDRTRDPLPPQGSDEAATEAENSGTETASKPRRCPGFEPQRWRSGWCKNCFRRAADHGLDHDEGDGGQVNTETATEEPAVEQVIQPENLQLQSTVTGNETRPCGGDDNTDGKCQSGEQETTTPGDDDDSDDDDEEDDDDDNEEEEVGQESYQSPDRDRVTDPEQYYTEHKEVVPTDSFRSQQPQFSTSATSLSDLSTATTAASSSNFKYDRIPPVGLGLTGWNKATSSGRYQDESGSSPLSRRLTAMNEDRKLEHDFLMAESSGSEAGPLDHDGGSTVIKSLREKVSTLDERNAQLDREKAALADLLAAKKREYDQMRQHYRDRVADLEEETQRLKAEKIRLVDKLQLPESERGSLVVQENEIAKLRKRLDEAESRSSEVLEENVELKREVKDLQLEIEEMHDQFRDEETAEFRELQRELEATAKACRIVNFKLRKAERRCEQLEAERVQAEEKARLLEARFRSTDDRQHLLELEEELRMAKEVSVRLHDDVEAVEEKRARYEEELDRVNDLLTESETRRQTLQKEVDMLVEQLKRYQSGTQSPGSVGTIDLSKLSSSRDGGGSDVDIAQLMRDLSDNLERENDLKEQLRFAEEETRVMRKKLSELEEENESLTLQVHKLSTAKSGRFAPVSAAKKSDGGSTSTGADGLSSEVDTEREREMRLQMELAEQEVKVLRRKLDSVEKSYDVLLDEVRTMRVRVEGRDSSAGLSSTNDAGKSHDEKVHELVRDIERLKWRLIEKDKDAAEKSLSGRRSGSSLQKSRSLEDDRNDSANQSGGHGGGDSHHQFDIKMQLDTVRQEAQVLREKLDEVLRTNDQLTNENKRLHILSGRSSAAAGKGAKVDDEATKLRELEAENATLRDRVTQLDDRNNVLAKEIVRAKFRGQQQQMELESMTSPTGGAGTTAEAAGSGDSTSTWRELRAQIQFLDDECRGLRRKIVDLEADKSKLKLELTHARGETDPKHTTRASQLEKETKDALKKRILELENELADMTKVVRNREEESERLSDELSESREDLDRMLDSFRRRERALLDDLETLRHRNGTLSDLLDLVNERAESAQKELDRCRAAATGSDIGFSAGGGGDIMPAGGSGPSEALMQKDWERRYAALERQLAEEKRRVQAAEKKLKMVDVPLSEVKDDTRLRQHEKEILIQELELSQKQLKAADEQISDLKQRLLTVRESHEDIKEDYAKVSKELAQVREQSVGLSTTRSATGAGVASRFGVGVGSSGGKVEREPASWRWEKQELERQLRDHKKKLDDIYAEMKRNQVKWKAAGEDIARENQIKEELEKKIEKLREQFDAQKSEAEQNKVKVDELQEALKRNAKQWDKERQMLEADKIAAETDAKQKDDVIRSKDELIAQKNQLVAEKDAALKDRSEAVQQKEHIIQQKDLELEFKDRELRMRTDEVATFRSELAEYRSHLAERDERIRQLDEHLRRRDDRLKEKDDILQQINRRLVEKANQVSDMDKTIRQVIRKLQARDVDLGFCNAELRRVQAELKALQERIAELRRYADALESDLRAQTAENESIKRQFEAKLTVVQQDKDDLESQLKRMEEEHQAAYEQWKNDNDKLQIELKQTAEKLHAHDVSSTMNATEAFRLMMKEKESLIADKYKLNDQVNVLRRQAQTAENKWKSDKELLEKIVNEKTKALDEMKAAKDKLQQDVAKLRETGGAVTGGRSVPLSLTLNPSTSSAAGTTGNGAGGGSELMVSRSELERRERQWLAERATLDEYYDAAARSQSETVARLRESVTALRRENDGQLQLLQAARKALGDLRNRHDLSVAEWNDERARMDAISDQAEQYRSKVTELERNVDRLTTELNKADAKRREVENHLSTEDMAWKAERAAYEERLKKLEQAAGEAAGSKSSSSASTRVAEFRSKFEKFGSSKSKKSTDDMRRSVDIVDTNRDLERQLSDLETTRAEERKQLLERLETQKAEIDKENKTLRDRNAVLEKKARELQQLQRTVLDLQYRLVEDRSQWQLEVSQLQRHLEDSKRSCTQYKESVNLLLAEIARLRVLVGAVDNSTGGAAGTPDSGVSLAVPGSGRPRLRSLTPSAEKLRVRSTGAANGSSSIDQPGSGIKDLDASALQDLIQAVDATVRLAEELRQPSQATTPRNDDITSQRNHPLSSGFKRSLSSAEFEVSSATARVLAMPPESGYYSSRGTTTSSSSTSSGIGARWRQSGRSSSQDDPAGGGSDTSSTQDVASDVRRTHYQPTLSAVSQLSAGASSGNNRGSIYASGTRSAYGSRDPSPDTNGRNGGLLAGAAVRKISPYPTAPPNMIITPSHTPRRAESVEPEGENSVSMTSGDIQRLYERLNAIEKETATDLTFAATALGGTVPDVSSSPAISASDRRGRTMLKSASTAGIGGTQQQPNKQTVGSSFEVSSSAATANGGSRGIAAGSSKPSITVTGRSASVSPRTARKQFYDNYTSRQSGNDSAGATAGTSSTSGPSHRVDEATTSSSDYDRSGRSASVTRAEEQRSSKSSKLTSAASSFFQSIKDRRKLFGGKKSSSVDSGESVTGTSIARIGANVLTEPAAPSTYQPPTIPDPSPVVSTTLGRPKGGALAKLHRRTASVDIPGGLAADGGAKERSASTTRDGKNK